ncbi:MAG: hypothetical protein ABIQ18_20660 [Umezawaea sp.]
MRRLRQGTESKDNSAVARAVLDKAGRLLLAANVRTLTDGSRQPLDIPESLRRGCPGG